MGTDRISRREFVVRGAAAGAGIVAAPAAFSLAACTPPAPSAPPPANVWAPVSVAELEPFVPRWVEFAVADLPIEGTAGTGEDLAPADPAGRAVTVPGGTPGDTQTPGTGGAWLVRGSDGTVTAFAPWCTHLLCLYDYDSAKANFLCRCHAGRYNLSGVPIEGPPPRRLWQLETRATTDPGVIEVGWYRKA